MWVQRRCFVSTHVLDSILLQWNTWIKRVILSCLLSKTVLWCKVEKKRSKFKSHLLLLLLLLWGFFYFLALVPVHYYRMRCCVRDACLYSRWQYEPSRLGVSFPFSSEPEEEHQALTILGFLFGIFHPLIVHLWQFLSQQSRTMANKKKVIVTGERFGERLCVRICPKWFLYCHNTAVTSYSFLHVSELHSWSS